MNKLDIVMAGLGVVGSSVIKYIEENLDSLEKNLKSKINIQGICARNKNKKRIFIEKNYPWFDHPVDMLNKTKPDIYIELMGYEKDISYDSIKFAILNKINVITANKALLANYGDELFPLADNNNVNIFYEAAVAGGIPIIKIIKESLVGNNITKISGILNGTTNYILSNMTLKKISFEKALISAKEKGYVEANSDLDIEGIDSAHKLSLISSLSFKSKLAVFNDIYREGISKIDKIDIDFAAQLNLVIKLLSVVELKDDKLIQYVRPVMINKDSQLAQVNDVLNGIQITTSELGKIFFEGKGAGGEATASSIISDIASIKFKEYLPSLGLEYSLLRNINNLDIEEYNSSYYMRLMVEDKPGVLAEITSLLKDNEISIEALIQDPLVVESSNNHVPLIITTHETYFRNVKKSVHSIELLENVKDNPVVIQIDKV